MGVVAFAGCSGERAPIGAAPRLIANLTIASDVLVSVENDAVAPLLRRGCYPEGGPMRILHYSCIIVFVATVGCGDRGPRVNSKKDLGVGGGDGSVSTDHLGQDPDPPDVVQDPKDCTEAAANKSYIGCDYWPTVTANAVWNIFDFAVVVSNPGTNPAMVTVTGPKNTNQTVTVQPGAVEKIYLPWVDELKGADADECGASTPLAGSVLKTKGAFHLVSTAPVLVYQFNALEYKGQGGAANKSWAMCPGTVKACALPSRNNMPIGCFSFSNDASLLLPSTAMTGNYRFSGEHGTDGFPGMPPLIPAVPGIRSYMVITATQDNTSIKVKVSGTGQIMMGTNVQQTAANGTLTLPAMNAGDVVELVSPDMVATDLSGSLVQADKPIQVIGGAPCWANPSSCDHIEETILPAETLGREYLVNMPTGPHDVAVPATVRFVGNVDDTKLTYTPAVPGAPATLNAGQVVELDSVSVDFLVTGDHEFMVSTVQKSASVVDKITAAPMQKGDPSLSNVVAVKQYRLKYVFLAPDDYDRSYADVVAPMNATMMLDGAAVTKTPTAVGSTGYGVFRIRLGWGKAGAHTLEASSPVGVQVIGYGTYTSYQYPGGLNLLSIAPPPPPIS